MTNCRLFTIAAVIGFVVIPLAEASVITSPQSVVNNTMGTFPGYPEDNMLNQSGLSATFTSGVTKFDSYIAQGPSHAFQNTLSWFSPSGANTGRLDYALGGVFLIDRLALWNESAFFAVNEFEVFTSPDASFSSPTSVGSFAAHNEHDFGVTQVQVFSLSPTIGRFVRLEINSNHGSSQTGIGELAFGVIPEPSALCLVASGLLGWARRKRR